MRRWIALPVLLLAAACMGTRAVRRPAGPDRAFVYGRIHSSHAIRNVRLYKEGVVYAPPFKSPPTAHGLRDGTFFFEDLEPGRYFLQHFMVGNDMYLVTTDKESLARNLFELKPGAVHFLGEFEVADVKKKLLGKSSFSFEKKKAGDRKAPLSAVLEAVKGTGWDVRLRKELGR